MIRKNQKRFNRLNVFIDGVLVLLCYLFSSWFWLDVVKNDQNMAGVESLRSNIGWAAVLYAVWTVTVLGCLKVYQTSRVMRMNRVLLRIVLGNAMALVTVAAALYLFRLQEFSRGVLVVFYITVCAALVGKRLVMRVFLRHIRKRGYNLKHMLVVGSGALAQRYVDTVTMDSALGIHVDRVFRPEDGRTARELEARLHGNGIDEVILALEPEETDATVPMIELCEKSGTKVSILPFYNDVIPTRPNIDTIGQLKLIQLRTTPLDDPLNAMMKRGFDVVISAVLLVILSPFMLLIALAVKLSSPGPVLFRQERVGLNKCTFWMLKFRSMRVNKEQDTGWSTQCDERRTKIGSFLRKISMDELPQLINVLKGEMSLVGPRPEIPCFVEQFRETVPRYMVKHQVRPGITGWAQVNGLRGDTSISERVEHDLWYIENWSFGLDLKILLMTVFGGMWNDEKLLMHREHQG